VFIDDSGELIGLGRVTWSKGSQVGNVDSAEQPCFGCPIERIIQHRFRGRPPVGGRAAVKRGAIRGKLGVGIATIRRQGVDGRRLAEADREHWLAIEPKYPFRGDAHRNLGRAVSRRHDHAGNYRRTLEEGTHFKCPRWSVKAPIRNESCRRSYPESTGDAALWPGAQPRVPSDRAGRLLV